jgi:hypothetical protein
VSDLQGHVSSCEVFPSSFRDYLCVHPAQWRTLALAICQRPGLSDVDVLLCVENADTPSDDSASDNDNTEAAYTVLQQFPAHRSILSASPVFEAQVGAASTIRSSSRSHAATPPHSKLRPDACVSVQVLRWQTEEPAADNSSSSSQRQIRLTLPDDSYQPAAMAVLAFLYSVKPEPLAELSTKQLVQAAVLADMWQVPAACSRAMELLTAIADSAEGLPTAAFDQLLRLPAVPITLQPLLEQALLSRFGDLEAVWADAALQKSLLALPLFAMELLLASDKLKVG